MPNTETRQQRLTAALTERELDAVILVSPGNVCYASGVETFLPVDAGTEFAGGPPVAVACADGDIRVLVPEAHAGLAATQLDGAELVAVPGFGHFEQRDPAGAFRSAVRDALRELIGDRARVGLEPRWVPESVVTLLHDEFPTVERVDADEAMLSARAIKTPWELKRINAAGAVADAAQERLRASIRTGVNELALWGEVTGAATERAGHAVAIVGEIVSGPRTGAVRYPGGPVDRLLKAGDTVLMDFSVRVNGYWADCCNTLVVDADPTNEQLRCYRASRAAIDAALDALVPGHTALQVEAAAREALAEHGFEPAHYTGHQIGVVVNEPPRLVSYDTSEIRAGMVFALEPGAYGGELGTGSRSEKMALVGHDGPELISRFAWGMDQYLA